MYLTPDLGLGYLEPSGLINAQVLKVGQVIYSCWEKNFCQAHLHVPLYIYFALYVYILASLPGPAHTMRGRRTRCIPTAHNVPICTQSLDTFNFILRACARGKGISFVCRHQHKNRRIWGSRCLNDSKYSISVDIIEKLASLCFESFGKVHEHRKYCILLATPINTTHHVLSANLAQFVGKGRQQTAGGMHGV